jgi:hypothetical protein
VFVLGTGLALRGRHRPDHFWEIDFASDEHVEAHEGSFWKRPWQKIMSPLFHDLMGLVSGSPAGPPRLGNQVSKVSSQSCIMHYGEA